MKIYTLHTKQKLPISLDQAWEFLANPRNLKIITPDYMGFKTLSGDERDMFAGQIIQYKVLLPMDVFISTLDLFIFNLLYFVQK